jgi:TolA-binding protein
MRRAIPAVLAVLLAVSALAVAPAAMAQQTDTDESSENETIEPGAQLSGVVGVGEAELNGDVEERAYGIRIAQANTDDAKAAVVAEQLNRSEQRIAELEQRRAELEQARENGSISNGQYRAQVAQLHAESRTVERLNNQTNETANDLPAETLEANGVNVTAIRTLSERASELSGPETARVARTIAGASVGADARPGEADRRGGADNETEERGGDAVTPTAAANETATDTETTSDSGSDTSSGSDGSTAGGSGSDSGSAGGSSGGY